MPKQTNKADDPIDSPTAWFAVLERARRTHDYELAAQAQRELRRLGVIVRFIRPKAKGQQGGAHA
jgi:hypothetical protein